jgi:hypothetical protein
VSIIPIDLDGVTAYGFHMRGLDILTDLAQLNFTFSRPFIYASSASALKAQRLKGDHGILTRIPDNEHVGF